MNPMEHELKRIRLIRKLRSESVRRAQAKKENELQEAQRALTQLDNQHHELERQTRQDQKQALAGLKNAGAVRVDQLIEFTRLQQNSSKSLVQSQRGIDSASAELNNTREACEEFRQTAVLSERRLIKIEEAIDSKPWK